MNEDHAIAVLLSLLDPVMVSAYLNGSDVVSKDYVINPANFVDYPDMLGLFNSKKERIEFCVFLNTLPENHTLRFDLYNFLGFLLGNNRFVKTALLGMVSYVLIAANSSRYDILVVKRFRNYHIDHDFFIYEKINEEVNNLWEFGYFVICYSTDTNSLIPKPYGRMLSEFKTVGRAIADTYVGYRKMLESKRYFFLVYRLSIKYDITMDEPPLFLVQFYYYSRGNDVKSINLKTLAMVSKAFYNGCKVALKHLHLDPVSLIKSQKNIHSIALECVDQLPDNNLTRIYKNIVDFSEGKTTTFTDEAVGFLL